MNLVYEDNKFKYIQKEDWIRCTPSRFGELNRNNGKLGIVKGFANIGTFAWVNFQNNHIIQTLVPIEFIRKVGI